MEHDVLLEMKNISKEFPGVKALDNVSLTVRRGTVHALMGENGAGKSTLMKCLFGMYVKDGGSISLEGKEINFKNSKEALENGVAMVHQELNQALKRSVMDNIWLGRYPKKGPMVDEKKMYDDTKALFDKLEIDVDPKRIMSTMPVSQRQMAEIAKAVSFNSKIIVFDEPTSSLTEEEVEHLFKIINMLRDQGCGIIYISHKMAEILRISDDITVMRDGTWVATKPAKEMTMDEIIRLMVGRELTDIYPKDPVEIGDVILEVKNLSRGKKVRDASFSLRKGEVLGIAGLVGAGRSELVETIFGLYPKTGGQIFLHGKEVHIKSAADAIKNKMALITEDRKQTGLNLIVSVKENIASVSIGKLSNHGIVNDKKINEVSEKYIKELKIKTPDGNAIVGNLSGGNQQKVVLAKWLLDEPDIIIFDEPTRGIDIGAKRDIYLLINNLAKEGKAVIVISSEMAEVMGICDRILVMAEGRINGEVQREEFSQEVIMGYASNITGGEQK